MSGVPIPFSLNVAEIKQLLEMLGQVPRKRHGQNFLHSWPTIERVIESCGFEERDSALEIGPGLGAFTFNIARRVKNLHVIELNPAFARYLEQKKAELHIENLTITTGDALKVDFPPSIDKIFSAMPYSISAPLTFKILDYMQQQRATKSFLTCQKEFGEKLVAPAGSPNYGRITANLSLVTVARILLQMSRNNFYPVPEVDSVLVGIESRNDLPSGLIPTCIELNRSLFPYKNKLLKKAMVLHARNPTVAAWLRPDLLASMPFKELRVRELGRAEIIELARWYEQNRAISPEKLEKRK